MFSATYNCNYASLETKKKKKSTFSYFFACILSLARSRTNPQVLDTGLTPQDWLTQPDWDNTNGNSPNSLSPLEIDIFSFWPTQMQQRDNEKGKGPADLSSCALKMRIQQVQKGIKCDTQPLFAFSSHVCSSSWVKAPKQKYQLYTTNSIGILRKLGHLLSECVVLCLHMSSVSVLTL